MGESSSEWERAERERERREEEETGSEGMGGGRERVGTVRVGGDGPANETRKWV